MARWIGGRVSPVRRVIGGLSVEGERLPNRLGLSGWPVDS
jgi:hypothetical protein